MLRKITFPLSDHDEPSLVNPSPRSPLFLSKHVEASVEHIFRIT